MHDREIELLTGFIDGQLTRRERIEVLRLLNQSSEARRLLWQLQQNSQLVKGLPARSLPADFSDRIVDMVKKTASAEAGQGGQPVLQPSPAGPLRLGGKVAWRLAWAAALLLAVGGGLFYFFRGAQEPAPIAHHGDVPPPTIPDNRQPPVPPGETPPPTATHVDQKPAPKAAPRPFADRTLFAELRKEPQRKLLEEELKKGRGVRVDLFVKNQRQALTRLGGQLRFEIPASKKTREKPLPLYVENLRPAEVVHLLGKLAADDKGTFEQLSVQPMSATDTQLLCQWMQIEPDELNHPVERTKMPNIIEGKGGGDLPLPAQPAEPKKKTQPRALLLVKDDVRQIRDFVEQRAARKDGTLQVLLMIHSQTQPVAAERQFAFVRYSPP